MSERELSNTEIAQRIRQYWERRGWAVNVWFERVEYRGLSINSVRTDMLNGHPVRTLGEVVQ